MSTTPLQKLTRDTLEEKGWSIRQASLQAGLSHSTLHKLLHSENPRPTAKTVLRLAELFGWDKVQALELAGLGTEQVEERIRTLKQTATDTDTNLEVSSRLQELNSTLLVLGEKLDILILLLATLVTAVESPQSKDRESLKATVDQAGDQVAELMDQRYVESVTEALRRIRH